MLKSYLFYNYAPDIRSPDFLAPPKTVINNHYLDIQSFVACKVRSALLLKVIVVQINNIRLRPIFQLRNSFIFTKVRSNYTAGIETASSNWALRMKRLFNNKPWVFCAPDAAASLFDVSIDMKKSLSAKMVFRWNFILLNNLNNSNGRNPFIKT